MRTKVQPMAPVTTVMGCIIGLIIAAAAAELVNRDQQKLAYRGIQVGQASARAWGYGVFLVLILFLPLYLWRRDQAMRRHLARTLGW
jgi:hypothetical protein